MDKGCKKETVGGCDDSICNRASVSTDPSVVLKNSGSGEQWGLNISSFFPRPQIKLRGMGEKTKGLGKGKCGMGGD